MAWRSETRAFAGAARGAWIALLLLGNPLAGAAEPPAPDDALDLALQLQAAFANVAQRTLPSVVSVEAYVAEPTPASEAQQEAASGGWRSTREARLPGFRRVRAGSGFVVAAEGYVLTCRHLLVDPASQEEVERIEVELSPGLRLTARLVAAEPNLDLAILKVEPPHPLRAITVGDSDRVAVGHWAIALGDPEGAGKTFVPGTITALPERECYQEELQSTLLQTTLTLDPRSYGGPLVDIRGAVIGINRPQSFIGEALPELAPRGSEFALPINLAMTIYEPMVARESRKSPWLGFSVLPMTPELRGRVGDAAVIGIYIDAVFDPSPASRASIRVGDLLAAMDGRPISSVPRFQRQLYLTGIGNPVRLRLYRDGRFFERELVVEQRPQAARPR